MQANLGSLHYYTHTGLYTLIHRRVHLASSSLNMILLWDNSIYLQYHQKKIPHHTTTYKNSSNYYVKKARSSHLQTKKKQDQFFFSSFCPLLRTERRRHPLLYPQTRPHVTKGRQVGHFSRPETDDADVVNIKFVLVDEFQ